MIKAALHTLVDRVADTGTITADDVKLLQREVLRDGIATREEADVLIALDRVAAGADPSWPAFLVGAVVDFAVWGARPTGYVDQDTARWLVASLSCGTGPTETAVRIAFEVVKEAQEADEALLAFVMRHPERRPGADVDMPAVRRAA